MLSTGLQKMGNISLPLKPHSTLMKLSCKTFIKSGNNSAHFNKKHKSNAWNFLIISLQAAKATKNIYWKRSYLD